MSILFLQTDVVNVLYVDLPIGIGFSYTESPAEESYSNNSNQISSDLVDVINYAFKNQPHLKSSPFFLYAESLACKYTIQAAYNLFKVQYIHPVALLIIVIMYFNPPNLIQYK